MNQSRSVLVAAGFLGIACLWAGCTSLRKEAAQDPPEPPNPYVGAAVCAQCHAETFRRQSASHHALTLRPSTPEWEAASIPPNTRVMDKETGLAYSFNSGRPSRQVVTEGDRVVASAPVDQLLGSGHHAVSLLTRDTSGWRYLSLTNYARKGWDFSPMHTVKGPEARRQNAAGWPVGLEDVRRCFSCHSTQLQFSGTALDPARTEEGVRCESCHGPGRAHVEAARARSSDLKINNPARWSTKSFMALCQQCHNETSTLDGVLTGISEDPTDPRTVKYHVYGLEKSRCFTQSKGALRCTTCHDPHGDTERRPAFYEARCLNCHQQPSGVTCPVNGKDGCLSCHMPKVNVEKYTDFADHWIRARSPFVPRKKAGGAPRRAS